MTIRNDRPGDEDAQARVYNAAAVSLPSFKPATAEEVARRYLAAPPDAGSRFFALDDAGGVVGYALFNPNGRVSYPWCVPGWESCRGPLLEAVLSAMTVRGHALAWAAYRGDWSPVLEFFEGAGFAPAREMVNLVAETSALPGPPADPGLAVGPLGRDDLPRLHELGRGLFPGGGGDDPARLGAFFWENPYFGADSLFAVRADGGRGEVVGAALAVATKAYAEPVKVDPGMPCFRLGAFGTEHERHKRVNGVVSCVFEGEPAGEALLAEASRRLAAAGLTHAAAQVPSDRPDLLAFFGRFFRRQGSFPVLTRRLGGRADG